MAGALEVWEAVEVRSATVAVAVEPAVLTAVVQAAAVARRMEVVVVSCLALLQTAAALLAC